MDSELYWSREQMRQQLGCGRGELQELTSRQDNPLPSFRIGRRVLYPKALVRAWVNDNPKGLPSLRRVA